MTLYIFIHLFSKRAGGRIAQLTFEHGISKYSALGLAMIGKLFCVVKDYDRGYLFGELSLAVVHKFKAKDLLPKVTAYVYGDILYYKKPYRCLFQTPLDAIFKSLEVGCNESSRFNFSVFLFYSFCSGKPLNELVEDFDRMSTKVHDIGLSAKVLHQSFLNITGHADGNPGLLIGTMFDYRIHLDFDNDLFKKYFYS